MTGAPTAPGQVGDPRVTTVVMTRDRWPSLQGSLPRHSGPVILVDNGSMDGTPSLVAEHFPQVEVIALEHNQGAVARNVGVQRARTPYVAFADDDSWWAPGAVTRAADLFDEHSDLAVLAARILVGAEEREDPMGAVMAGSPLPRRTGLPGPSILGFLACGAVVRREAFLSAGGFDPVVFFMGEEERLALDLRSAGWQLCYVDDVMAHHHPGKAGVDRSKADRIERNRLLTTLMRRPWTVVLGELGRAVAGGRERRRGARAAWPAIPAALAARRTLSRVVEQERRLLN